MFIKKKHRELLQFQKNWNQTKNRHEPSQVKSTELVSKTWGHGDLTQAKLAATEFFEISTIDPSVKLLASGDASTCFDTER